MGSALDIGLLIIVLISLIAGIWRGLVRSVISLAVFVVGVGAALALSPALGGILQGSVIEHEWGAVAIAALAIFVVVMLLGAVINLLVQRLLKSAELKGTDRALGGLFGVMRSLLVMVLLGTLLYPFADRIGERFEGSIAWPLLMSWGEFAVENLPAMKEYSEKPFAQLRGMLETEVAREYLPNDELRAKLQNADLRDPEAMEKVMGSLSAEELEQVRQAAERIREDLGVEIEPTGPQAHDLTDEERQQLDELLQELERE